MKFTSIDELRKKNKFVFGLIGNPNVGKSSIFNQLTGLGVETANYPGKTVNVNLASTKLDGLDIGLVDLPGVYSAGGISEDQWVARQVILEENLDAVIIILDATNLSRNLYLLLQMLDLGFPVIAALNLIDLAEKQGLRTDIQKLEQWLGIKVVPTIAVTGQGVEQLLRDAVKLAQDSPPKKQRTFSYSLDIEEEISNLVYDFDKIKDELPFNLPRTTESHPSVAEPPQADKSHTIMVWDKPVVRGLPSWAWAVLALEKDQQFLEILKEKFPQSDLLEKIKISQLKIQNAAGQDSSISISIERHNLAKSIVSACQFEECPGIFCTQKLWRYATHKIWGFVFLALSLIFVFGILFYVGGFLSRILTSNWEKFVSPVLDKSLIVVFGDFLGKILKWGIDDGILAALAVGVPYVFVFYFLLAFLEDTGYLNALVFLIDRFMHKIGLHGRAVICLVAGLGCNVPAIIGTRVLNSTRERTIASFLITLVPCSARIAVIVGAVALFIGPVWALAIFFISFLLIMTSGFFLNKILPEKSVGLVMEVFPFRQPNLINILKKTWYRFKDFVLVAAPVIIIGSMVLGILYETKLIWKLSAPMAPVVEGVLGLPAITGLALLFAVLRKELALQLLLALAIIQYGGSVNSLLVFMTKSQIFIYTLFNTIYIPCIATIAVLAKELGIKRAVYISIATIALAVVICGVVNKLLLIWPIK